MSYQTLLPCCYCAFIHNKLHSVYTPQEVDIAAAPMYVTRPRKRVVAFTERFRTVAAAVVIRSKSAMELKINSLRDLLSLDPKVIFGTLEKGVIHRTLKRSNDSLVRTMYSRMLASKELSFTSSNEQGLERMRQKPLYAYVLQDVIAEYLMRRAPCDLTIVAEIKIDSHFALAVNKGSGLIPKLNRGLQKLNKSGELDQLYYKWWWKDQCHDLLGRALNIRSGNNPYDVLANSASVLSQKFVSVYLIAQFFMSLNSLMRLLPLQNAYCECPGFVSSL